MANQDNALLSMETMIYMTHVLRKRENVQGFFGDTQGCKDTELRRRLRLYSEDVLMNWSLRNKDFSFLQQQAVLMLCCLKVCHV